MEDPTIFRYSAAISKHTHSFLEDTTSHKSRKKLEIRSRHEEKAVQYLSSNSLQSIHERTVIRADFEDKIALLSDAIGSVFNFLDTMQIAAIKIQRVFRKYSASRNLDKKCLSTQRDSLIEKLHFQKKSDYEINFHSGLLPNLSAQKIQKTVKLFLFRQKIARLARTYDYFINIRTYAAFDTCLRAIKMYTARAKVKWRSFKITRGQKLLLIRTKLAIATLKKYWKLLGLNYLTMCKRIRRYARRLDKAREAAEQANNKDTEAKDLEEKEGEDEGEGEGEGEGEAEGENEEKELQIPDDDAEDSEEERIRLKQEAEIRLKVKMGKISYQVPKSNKKKFLPYLQKKPVEEEDPAQALLNRVAAETTAIDVPPQYKHLTNRIFKRQGRHFVPVIETAEAPKLAHTWVPSRKYKGSIPRYMQQTASSQSGKGNNPPVFFNEIKKKTYEKRSKSTLMAPTQAFVHKKAHKIQADEKVWKPSVLMKETYTPALDNSDYSPKSSSKRESLPLIKKRFFETLPENDSKLKIPPEPELVFQALIEFPTPNKLSSKELPIHIKPRVELMKGYLK